MLRRKSATLGRSFAGSVGGYLPSTLTEMWDPQRDFAFLKLPVSGVKTMVALSRYVVRSRENTGAEFAFSSVPQVMVVTSEGSLHVYSIDLESGGECVLQKSYK